MAFMGSIDLLIMEMVVRHDAWSWPLEGP
jgi:hypothetical protein